MINKYVLELSEEEVKVLKSICLECSSEEDEERMVFDKLVEKINNL